MGKQEEVQLNRTLQETTLAGAWSCLLMGLLISDFEVARAP